jgi:hypothetical protein
VRIIFVVLGCVTLARGLAAEGNSSLSESKVENAEPSVNAAALLAQNEGLRRQLSIEQESLKTLMSSLAESNAEAELFRPKYSDLELRMEALGLASANKDRAKLEQRLLAAVSDLRLAQQECEEYRDQMVQLNEAMGRYLKTAQSGDSRARLDIEAQLRGANALATRSTNASPNSAPLGLMDGNVISVKDEWSFVVGNLGETQGVKIAGDSRRPEDRDAAGCRCSAENLRRGDSRNGL